MGLPARDIVQLDSLCTDPAILCATSVLPMGQEQVGVHCRECPGPRLFHSQHHCVSFTYVFHVLTHTYVPKKPLEALQQR